MNKFFGKKTDFTLVRADASRIIISYEKKDVDETNCTWYEVYFYKNKKPNPSFIEVKEAVLNDINAQTDEKIISGMIWTPAGGEPINVWLSDENQRNYSEADRKAKDSPELVLPVTFKLGEDADKNPVYYTFTTYEELDSFYMQAFGYINQCLNEGWARKDAIDWNDYSVFFPVTE